MNPITGKGRRHHVYPCDMYCGLLERSWCQNGLKSDVGELLEVIFVPVSTFKAPPRTQFAADRAERHRVRLPQLIPYLLVKNWSAAVASSFLSDVWGGSCGRLSQRLARDDQNEIAHFPLIF